MYVGWRKGWQRSNELFINKSSPILRLSEQISTRLELEQPMLKYIRWKRNKKNYHLFVLLTWIDSMQSGKTRALWNFAFNIRKLSILPKELYLWFDYEFKNNQNNLIFLQRIRGNSWKLNAKYSVSGAVFEFMWYYWAQLFKWLIT
jgi:hypothetical protein